MLTSAPTQEVSSRVYRNTEMERKKLIRINKNHLGKLDHDVKEIKLLVNQLTRNK